MKEVKKVLIFRLIAALAGVVLLLWAAGVEADEPPTIGDIIESINGEIAKSSRSQHYLTDEQNEHLNSKACDDIYFNDEQQEIADQAYTVFWCANYVRLAQGDYKRGWYLHRLGSRVVRLVDPDDECKLRNPADNMAYGTYIEVKGVLEKGGKITNRIKTYCAELSASAELDPEV